MLLCFLFWVITNGRRYGGARSSFCGSLGVEWCEPTLFKGRKGYGLSGGRKLTRYVSLLPRARFRKSSATSYRVWCHAISTELRSEEWRAISRRQFGPAAPTWKKKRWPSETDSAPVHDGALPVGCENNYWTEIVDEHAIVKAGRRTLQRYAFSQRFGGGQHWIPNYFCELRLCDETCARRGTERQFSPVAVASLLESWPRGEGGVKAARIQMPYAQDPEFGGQTADIAILVRVGRILRRKLRAPPCGDLRTKK